MEKLQQKVRELLQDQIVDLVIGYEQVTNGEVRPAFIRTPEQTDRLYYSNECVQNLVVYLSKKELKKFKKVALVAPVSILKNLIILAGEHQITDQNVKVLGVNQENDLIEFNNFKEIESYIKEHQLGASPQEKTLLEELEKMTAQQRWEFWQNQFSKCFKCYACRAVCPSCYCSRCTVESNQPQWIYTAPHALGNFEWHLMRAMHLAGRCSNCGACARACPMDIPLNLLNLKTSQELAKNFNFHAGFSAEQPYVLSHFRTEDKENFIE